MFGNNFEQKINSQINSQCMISGFGWILACEEAINKECLKFGFAHFLGTHHQCYLLKMIEGIERMINRQCPA